MTHPDSSDRAYLFEDPPPKIRLWFKWTITLLILSGFCPDDFSSPSTWEYSFMFIDSLLKLAAGVTFLRGFMLLIDHKRLSRGLLVLAPLTIIGLIIVMLIPPNSSTNLNPSGSNS